MTEARFPLRWPDGWPRTPPMGIRRAPFMVSQEQAQRELIKELGRLGARDIILSTNVAVRRDGMPYANRRQPDDQGAAVYFTRKGRRQVLACDRFMTIGDNIRAIGKTIEALRGIERWGASDMLDRAFTGFEALPAPDPWWIVLGIGQGAAEAEIRQAYRAAARDAHPDAGGDRAAWDRIQTAYGAALKAVAR